MAAQTLRYNPRAAKRLSARADAARPDFRQTARLSWDRPRTPYRPSRIFVRIVLALAALIVLVEGMSP